MSTPTVSQRLDPARLRAAREAAGMTREVCAVKVGLSYGAIVSYEQGGCSPSLPALCKLAHALGVPVGTLFTDSGTES